jgi:uncharacterized membrane protein YsdA (DUF1294 family)
MKYRRTSESLTLLINYIALIGIWFAIPSVSLFLHKDERWPIAATCLGILVIILVIAYILQWKVLFPTPAAIKNEDNTVI